MRDLAPSSPEASSPAVTDEMVEVATDAMQEADYQIQRAVARGEGPDNEYEIMARAALEAALGQPAAPAWRTRDSAPKDGTEFIACNPGYMPFSMCWHDGAFIHQDPVDGWVSPPFELWQPFPAAPAVEGQKL